MIPYPSIEQFKNCIKQVTNDTRYAGKDENGKAIYNNNSLPTLTFTGTCKIHGSNASIVYNGDKLIAQSRQRELSVLSDNHGFCAFTIKNEKLLKNFCELIIGKNDTVVVYGEWFGKGINSNVAVNELDKKFAIFGIKFISGADHIWVEGIGLDEFFFGLGIEVINELNNNDIYYITQFGVWQIDIDFNHPELVQNEVIKITNDIEKECPVGKYFGISGIGEGCVFSHNGEHFYQWKSKGQLHSVSKVKSLAPIDEEMYNNIKEFAETYTNEARLEQGLSVLRDELLLEPIDKNTGAFIKWVVQDIIKEEKNNIAENGFDFKKVSQEISKIASKWYLNKI